VALGARSGQARRTLKLRYVPSETETTIISISDYPHPSDLLDRPMRGHALSRLGGFGTKAIST
jgi:hypothetical protein